MMDFLSAHAPSCRRSLSVGHLATSQFGHFAEEGFAYTIDTLVGRPLDDYASCYPMKKCRSHTSIVQATALEEAALHAANECVCYTVSSAPENAICVIETDGEPSSPPGTVLDLQPSTLLLPMHPAHSTTTSTVRSSRSVASLQLTRGTALASSSCSSLQPSVCGILQAIPTAAVAPTAPTDTSLPPSDRSPTRLAAAAASQATVGNGGSGGAGCGGSGRMGGCSSKNTSPLAPPQHQQRRRQSSCDDLMGAFSVLTPEQWEALRSAVADDNPGGGGHQAHGPVVQRAAHSPVARATGNGVRRHHGDENGEGGAVERLSPAGDSNSSIASLWAVVNNSIAANNSGVYDSTDDNILAGQRWLSADPWARRTPLAPPSSAAALPIPIVNNNTTIPTPEPTGSPADTCGLLPTSSHHMRVPAGACPAGSHYEHLRSPIRHQCSDPILQEPSHFHAHLARMCPPTTHGLPHAALDSTTFNSGGGFDTHYQDRACGTLLPSHLSALHPSHHSSQGCVATHPADEALDSPSADEIAALVPRSASCTHASGSTGGFPAARSPLLAGYYSHLPDDQRSSDSLSNLAETRTRAATRSSLDLYFYSSGQPLPVPLQQNIAMPPPPQQQLHQQAQMVQQQVLPRIRVGVANTSTVTTITTNNNSKHNSAVNGHVADVSGGGVGASGGQWDGPEGSKHQHSVPQLQQQHLEHTAARVSAGGLGSGSGGSSNGGMQHRSVLQTHRYYSPGRRRGSLATGSAGNAGSVAPSSSSGTGQVPAHASAGGGGGGGGGGGNTYLYRRAQSSFEAVSAGLQLGRGSSGFGGLGCGGARCSDNDADDDDDDTEETTRRITAAFRQGAASGGRSSGWGLLGADTAPVTPSGDSGARGRELWTTVATTGEGGGEEGEGAGQDGASGDDGGTSGGLTRKRSSYHLTNSHAAVELFLRLNHARQTMDFAKRQTMLFAALDKAVLSMWEALALLDELREYEAVLLAEAGEAQEIANLSLRDHAFQCAELCRLHHPDTDWMHLLGLIHGLGKLLSHRRFGSQPQWAICGETYPLGCRFSPHILGSQYFTANPDRRRRLYNTPTGPYGPGCGLLNAVMSWSAPEYLHLVLLLNGTKLPQDALWLLRHIKFLSLARPHSTYLPLCCPDDLRLLPLLRSLQSLTTYRRQELPPGFELEPGERTAYYTGLIEKYIGTGPLRW